MLVCGDRARRRAAAIDVVRRRACCAHLAPTLVVRPLRCPGGNLAKLAVCKTLAICFFSAARGNCGPAKHPIELVGAVAHAG